MIHPFAPFNAANTVGETLRERIELLQKPAADFAEFLQNGKTAAKTSGVATHSHTSAPLDLREETPSITKSYPADEARTVANPPRVRDSPAPESAAPTDPVPEPSASDTPAATGDETAKLTGAPRFADVPDSAKFPAGPYRQAPAEYGGEWWLVSPFSGEQPWLTQVPSSDSSTTAGSRFATENLPQDFLKAFGEKPTHRAGESGVDFVGRLARWKQDLEFFQQTGTPEGFDEGQVAKAGDLYEQWDMGRPVFYEGRYGWFARFPDSAIPEFEMDAASAVEASHLAIARYQVRLLQRGDEPATPHPFVPPALLESV